MKVSIIAKLDDNWFEFETPHTKLKSILNHLKQIKGTKFVKRIMESKCKYILVDSTGMFAPITLREDVVLEEFRKFDNLLVIEDITGKGGAIVSAIGSAALVTAQGALTTLGTFVAAAINIAISIALQFIIQALSPSPEFNTDPAASQADQRLSNLYNGVPLIRHQGGVCPMVFGRPYCGGVLISAGIYTSDVVA
jgi:hypothetical protein